MAQKVGKSIRKGTFIGIFCFPHGTITLDPRTRDLSETSKYSVVFNSLTKERCIELHDACLEQAKLLAAGKPDIIVFSSQHGLSLHENFVLLKNHQATGTAKWDNQWIEYEASMKIASEISVVLQQKLFNLGNAVEILGIGHPVEDSLPLRWGEVVPFWFINEAFGKSAENLRYVYVGQPSKTVTVDQSKNLMKFGSDLMELINNDEIFTGKRVAVVISGDMAHSYSDSPSCPFPKHPNAEVFDELIKEWASLAFNDEDDVRKGHEIISVKAREVVEKALSCGFTGWLMTQGIFQKGVQYGYKFHPKILAVSVPTYYGMMVNFWMSQVNFE